MRWILGLAGALFGGLLGQAEGLVLGLVLGALIGWAIEREQRRAAYLARRQRANAEGETANPDSFESRTAAELRALTRRVEQLERALAAREPGAERAAHVETSGHTERDPRDGVSARVSAPELGRATQAGHAGWEAPEPSAEATGDVHAGEPRSEPIDGPHPGEPSGGPNLAPRPPAAPPAWVTALRSFFLGGNTVVRVGVLVLTVGVGLLVKYAAENAYFPLELRLAAAAALGLGLVALGYKLRLSRPGFATALQGGGVAAIYLVTFFAYYAYKLLPGPLTMALLVAIAALSSLLAVVQDAVQLAVFGAIGGFLAPILASSGQGDHVALFSYYALLNGAIAASALFRAWRPLNWVGFLFTFGVASAWGALQYQPANMPSASFFLGLFFLMYLAIGTLFAFAPNQARERRGSVDTTLTFGTPLATLALASGLFRLEHLYLALACALISAVYLGTARFLVARREPLLSALTQAYVAIGIAVATLAIPFALEHALATSLAWAAEASGLIWVGGKQRRLRTRIGGYLLFAAALVALAARQEAASPLGRALFFALIACALGFGAARVARERAALSQLEPYVGHALFGTALLLWAEGARALIAAVAPPELWTACALGALALTTLLLETIGTAAHFLSARIVARAAFPLLLLSLPPVLADSAHPFANFGWLGYLAAIAAAYAVLDRHERGAEAALRGESFSGAALHAASAYLIALLSSAEARHLAAGPLALAAGWVDAARLIAPLAIAALALRALPRWPVAAHLRAYRLWSACPITAVLALLALISQVESDGDPAPLAYLPLLNPLDLAHGLVLAALVLLARTPEVDSPRARQIALWGAGGSAFIALNGSVARTAHHWADVPLEPWQIPTAPVVQAAFSILWTTLALVAMMVAHRRGARALWFAGATLLAAVVLKLFFLDLSHLSSVAKIITFLAVGVLLLAIGYLAPVPPAGGAAPERS